MSYRKFSPTLGYGRTQVYPRWRAPFPFPAGTHCPRQEEKGSKHAYQEIHVENRFGAPSTRLQQTTFPNSMTSVVEHKVKINVIPNIIVLPTKFHLATG